LYGLSIVKQFQNGDLSFLLSSSCFLHLAFFILLSSSCFLHLAFFILLSSSVSLFDLEIPFLRPRPAVLQKPTRAQQLAVA
jgi:hypothetical protein